MRSMMCRYIITKQWVEHKAFARTKVSRVFQGLQRGARKLSRQIKELHSPSNAFYNLVRCSHYLCESKLKLSDIRGLSE